MSATETPPIANDAEGAHSLHRLVGLLALAVMEMQPECVTPARCMIRHGPNCRVTRWETITAAIKAELRKQPNDQAEL